MDVLITGGCGFVGRHLSERMMKSHDISVVDINPDRKWLSENGIELVGHDILEWSPDKSYDIIIHLAAMISVSGSEKEPERYYLTNVEGTRRVAEWAVKQNSKLVFFSSAAVYGNMEKPASESDPLKPISLYGKTKALGESIVSEIPGSLIFRPFNIYGPGKTEKGVIERFVEQAKAGKPLLVRGGKQVRDFIHVNDVTRAVDEMIGESGIYNLGTGRGTSIEEIASIVAEMSGNELAVKHEPMPDEDVVFSVADTSKLFKLFKPEIKVEEGIRWLMEG